MTRKRSTAEERSLARMIDGLEDMETDLELMKRTRGIVPAGWSRAHKAAPCHPPKVKTTLRIDREVFDWYRSLGVGYQRRMNEVLRCYMHAMILKHIEQSGDRDWKDDPL
jgi:uncharacterized protein (DUF4415 family)